MTHTSQGFAEHFIGLLKNIGDTGDSGDRPSKSFNSKEKSVTKFYNHVSPVKTTGDSPQRATGDVFIAKNQEVIGPVTSVTSVTSNFAEGAVGASRPSALAEWHAIAAELKAGPCPDWLSVEAWKTLRSDAESFLNQWGTAAHQLGWAALDLFGVHPVAPACRFDVMGLVPILSGRQVVALTAGTATIRGASGAILTYRRADQTGAICITRVTP